MKLRQYKIGVWVLNQKHLEVVVEVVVGVDQMGQRIWCQLRLAEAGVAVEVEEWIVV